MLTGLLGLSRSVRAQEVTREQLRILTPDENEIEGFIRVRPAGEFLDQKTPEPIEDFVALNKTLKPPRTGTISTISRGFYSADSVGKLVILIKLCDSVLTAQQELTSFRKGASAHYTPGSFNSNRVVLVGDESFYAETTSKSLIFREGKLMVYINGGLSDIAVRQGMGIQKTFPADSIMLAAQIIQRHTGQFSGLTGVVSPPLPGTTK